MWITEIRLKNYRAFAEEVVVRIPEGSHLLVYGENGSGKSSLFRGVKEFFATAAQKDLEFTPNRWEDDKDADADGGVTISFGSFFDFTWQKGVLISEKFHQLPSLALINQLSEFLDYNSLLPHFRKRGEDQDGYLFQLLAEDLLAHATVVDIRTIGSEIRFGTLLKEYIDNLISLYPAHVQAIKEVNGPENTEENQLPKTAWSTYANLLPELNDAYYGLVTEINKLANQFLQGYFDPKLLIGVQPGEFTLEEVLDTDGLEYQFNPGKANFILYYAGKKLTDYHDFLNEARLSAFTLCFRLAAIKLLPVTEGSLRLLFLDDIFTGLDMNNRLPLLRLIKEEFIKAEVAPFQVGIATHDRSWYELAENWFKIEKIPIKTLEMYARPGNGPREPDVPVLLDRSSDPYEQAIAHFAIGDYTACAVNLRKAAERVAKSLLPTNKHHRHFPDGTKEERDLAELMTDAHNRLQDKIDDAKIFDRFSRIRGRILNPYAHDDGNAPFFRREMEEAIEVLWEWRRYKVVRLISAADGVGVTHRHEGRSSTIVFEENLDALYKDGALLAILRANCRCDEAATHSENLAQAVKFAWKKTHKGENLTDVEAVYDQFFLADGSSLHDLLTG